MSAVAVKAGQRPPAGCSLDSDGHATRSRMENDLRQEVMAASIRGSIRRWLPVRI